MAVKQRGMIGKKIDQKIRKVQLFPLWYGLFRIQKCQIIKCSDQFLHPFRFVQRCCDPPVLFSGQCRCQKQLQMTGNNCQRRAQIMGDRAQQIRAELFVLRFCHRFLPLPVEIFFFQRQRAFV